MSLKIKFWSALHFQYICNIFYRPDFLSKPQLARQLDRRVTSLFPLSESPGSQSFQISWKRCWCCMIFYEQLFMLDYVIIFQELYRLDALTKIKYSRCSFSLFPFIFSIVCSPIFSILATFSFFRSLLQFLLHSDFRRFYFLFLRRHNHFSTDFSPFKRQRSPVILLIIFIFIFYFLQIF